MSPAAQQRNVFNPHNYQRYCINRLLVDEALGLLWISVLGKQ